METKRTFENRYQIITYFRSLLFTYIFKITNDTREQVGIFSLAKYPCASFYSFYFEASTKEDLICNRDIWVK